MTEDFLHYLWQHKLYYSNDLVLTNGEKLQIISSGVKNTDGGPDFSNARIVIGNVEWAGNIEIHINASDWKKHNHQADAAYDNVILHIVYENDLIIKRKSGEEIPTFVLKNRFNETMFERYFDFINAKRWIPCELMIKDIERFHFEMWLERMLIERLETKTNNIQKHLSQNVNNWEQTFYEQIASSFGFKVNSVAFECLAKSLPISIIGKHKNSLFQIEALLFGQAGMLNKDFKDEYPQKLKTEYQFLQKKYDLKPISYQLWKFLRLRPANFPTIRIAQLASLIHQSSGLFSKLINSNTILELKSYFNIESSEYWHHHYSFDKQSRVISHSLGETSINLIIINTIIPFMYLYGKYYDNESFTKKSLSFNDLLPAEDNVIIRNFKQLSINTSTAFRSQALLQMKKEYCDKKRCLDCAIGNLLIKK